MVITLTMLLLLIAFVLFVLAAFPRVGRGWMLPIGLACWVLVALLEKF